MKKLNLPKGYISWSQYNLWTSNPAAYRREYYYGIKRHENPEMRYGDAVARMLESGAKGPVIDLIPRYSVSEYKIETEIAGVPVLAFVDSFEPNVCKFMEYKTGHKNRQGKDPWDTVKVRKHGQLPFYAAAIKAANGKCNSTVQLIWIETEALPGKEQFGSFTLESTDARSLRMTGRIEVFPRRITAWEVSRMEDLIRTSAMEISKDYTDFEKSAFSSSKSIKSAVKRR